MNILNDKIEFEAADFDGLSELALKSLAYYFGRRIEVGETIEFTEAFSKMLSASVSEAKEAFLLQRSKDPVLAETLQTLAAEDQAKYDEALTAIRTVLGLPVAVVEPSAVTTENTEDPSLWTKLTSLFK